MSIERIRELLPAEYQFYFFDGAYSCDPAPEVLDCFSPPYLTWYNTPTTDKILDAHNQVRRIIQQHGPFEAVLGFSQVRNKQQALLTKLRCIIRVKVMLRVGKPNSRLMQSINNRVPLWPRHCYCMMSWRG